MQWLDDAPEDWESAPEHPPSAADRDVTAETLQNGVTLRSEDSSGAYIYASEDALEDCT